MPLSFMSAIAQSSGKPLAQSNFDSCMQELLVALVKKGVRPHKLGGGQSKNTVSCRCRGVFQGAACHCAFLVTDCWC